MPPQGPPPAGYSSWAAWYADRTPEERQYMQLLAQKEQQSPARPSYDPYSPPPGGGGGGGGGGGNYTYLDENTRIASVNGRDIVQQKDWMGNWTYVGSYDSMNTPGSQLPLTPEERRRAAAAALLDETQALYYGDSVEETRRHQMTADILQAFQLQLQDKEFKHQSRLDRDNLDLNKWFGSIDRIQSQQGLDQAEQERLRRFGLDDRRFGLEAELGRGELDLARGQFGLDERRFGLEERGFEEQLRQARVAEEMAKRDSLLETANSAMSAFLRSTELADARKLAAFQETRALLPMLVNKNQRYFSGMGPGGTLSTIMGRYNLPFEPVEIQHANLNPMELMQAPPGSDLSGIGGQASDTLSSLLAAAGG